MSDLVSAFLTQGIPYFETWGDAQQALELVRADAGKQSTLRTGEAAVEIAGLPGSITRNDLMATLSAKLGRTEDEVCYLRRLVEQGWGSPDIHDRLAQIS